MSQLRYGDIIVGVLIAAGPVAGAVVWIAFPAAKSADLLLLSLLLNNVALFETFLVGAIAGAGQALGKHWLVGASVAVIAGWLAAAVVVYAAKMAFIPPERYAAFAVGVYVVGVGVGWSIGWIARARPR